MYRSSSEHLRLVYEDVRDAVQRSRIVVPDLGIDVRIFISSSVDRPSEMPFAALNDDVSEGKGSPLTDSENAAWFPVRIALGRLDIDGIIQEASALSRGGTMSVNGMCLPQEMA